MDHREPSSAAKNASSVETRPGRGLISVFTGDGRGKTSAAIGTAVRAAGYGLKVLIVFFMKGPDFAHGEISSLKNISNVTVSSFGARGWAKPGQDNTAHLIKAEEALSAVAFGLLPVGSVTRLMADKPAGLELILTGRNAPAEIVGKADLVTEMRNVKHPFDRGVPARAGIDY
jgi:cob(I)alamin adenosyltransferase